MNYINSTFIYDEDMALSDIVEDVLMQSVADDEEGISAVTEVIYNDVNSHQAFNDALLAVIDGDEGSVEKLRDVLESAAVPVAQRILAERKEAYA